MWRETRWILLLFLCFYLNGQNVTSYLHTQHVRSEYLPQSTRCSPSSPFHNTTTLRLLAITFFPINTGSPMHHEQQQQICNGLQSSYCTTLLANRIYPSRYAYAPYDSAVFLAENSSVKFPSVIHGLHHVFHRIAFNVLNRQTSEK